MSSGCKNGQKSAKVHPVNSACARHSLVWRGAQKAEPKPPQAGQGQQGATPRAARRP
ncbi:hypothetical protein A2U01_0092745, partial [Trifolium medium]|nr:hypothetical protein [Trifolium medium]